MKRIWTIVFTALLMIFLLTPSAFAEQGNITLVGKAQDGYSGEIFDSLCVIEDTLYVKGRNIYQWKPGDADLSLFYKIYPPLEELQKTREIPMFCGLVNFGGVVMTLDGYKGVLCEVREDGLIPTEYKIDVASFPDSTGDLESDIDRIEYMFGSEGRLFLVAHPSDRERNINMLYEANTKTGQITPLTSRSESIISAMPYKAGKLLIAIDIASNVSAISGEVGCLRIWDMATNDYTGETYTPVKDRGVDAVAYDAEQDIIYVIEGTRIYKARWDGAAKVVNYVENSYARRVNGAPATVGDMLAVCSDDSTEIYTLDPDRMIKKILKVMHYIINDDISLRFTAQNPNVVLDYIEGVQATLENLPTLIASGEAPDIFICANTFNLEAFVNKGYAMDISDDEELMQLVSELYPQLQEYLVGDGKLIGYPLMFSCGIWDYDAEAFEELGLGEFPETMEELIDLVVLWENEYAHEHPDKRLAYYHSNPKNVLFDIIVNQYVAVNEVQDLPVRFDTPEFRALMEKLEATPLKYATREDDEQREIDNAYYDEHYNGEFLVNFYTNISYNTHTLRLPPKVSPSDPPIAIADILVHMVNPDTKSRDLALDYIRLAAKEMDVDQRYKITPSLNEPIVSDWYEKSKRLTEAEYEAEKNREVEPSEQRKHEALLAEIEHQLKWIEDSHWQISAERIKEYRELAPYIKIHDPMLLASTAIGDEMRQIISRYQQGQLSLDQMIQELDRKAQMMYLENR